eukprot:2959359-Amphidinium_carterae.1
MPKSTSSGTASRSPSMRGFAAELSPVLQVNWVKPSFEPSKVRPTPSDLFESPSLAVLGTSGRRLTPQDKPTSSVPPGLTRVPINSLRELGQST